MKRRGCEHRQLHSDTLRKVGESFWNDEDQKRHRYETIRPSAIVLR